MAVSPSPTRPASDPAALLRRRAAELARPMPRFADAVDSTGGAEVIAFRLATQLFALERTEVSEATLGRAFTPLPGLPSTLRGLMNLRSRILPVFEVKSLLQLPAEADTRSRVPLLVVARDPLEFGLIVDEIIGPRSLPAGPLRRDVTGLQTQFLRGVATDGLILLDLPALASALTIPDRT